MKKLEFGVKINTNEAESSMQRLRREGERTKTSLGDMKARIRSEGSFEGEAKDPATQAYEGLSGLHRDTLEEMQKMLEAQQDFFKTQKSSLPPINSTKSTTSDDKSNPLHQTLGTIAGALMGGNFLKNYTFQGARRSREYESNALTIYNRIGNYGSDFNQARVDAHQKGSPWGYAIGQTMDTQDTLLQGAGFSDQVSLDRDTESTFKISRAYGFDPSSFAYQFGEISKLGTYQSGEANSFADIVASSIESAQMKGRENEQLQAVLSIADVISNGRISISSEDLTNLLNVQVGLAKQDDSLKGQRGAELASKFHTGLNPEDEQAMMLVGYKRDKFGIEGAVESQRLLERGLFNPETLQAFMENFPRATNSSIDSVEATYLISKKMGLPIDQTEALQRLLVEGRFKDATNLLEGQKAINEKADQALSSKAMTQERYDVNKENAQVAVGEQSNRLTAPLKDTFNNRSVGLQSAMQVGGGIAGYAFAGKALGKAGGFIGKGFQHLGKGSGFLDSLSFAGKGMQGASSTLGTIGKTIGKNAPLLVGMGYGIETVSHLAKGEHEEALGSVGAGAGAIGGGLLGAKLGATAGTAILPGAGTAIGAIGGLAVGGLGSIVGRKAGKGLFDLFGSDKVEAKEYTFHKDSKLTKEEALLEEKHQLVKKVDDIADKFVGEFVGEQSYLKDDPIVIKDEPAMDLYRSPEVSETSSLSQARKQYADQFALGGSTMVLPDGDRIGKIVEKFEAPNAGFVSSGKGDYGGKSYGLPQFSTKMGSADAFRKNAIDNSSEFSKFFEGVGKAGTKEFDKAWKKAFASNPKAFENLQISYNYDKNVVPFIEGAKKKYGVDLSKTRALQEIAYSTATQYGSAGYGVLGQGQKIHSDMTEEELIKAIYKNKRDTINSRFRSSSGSVKKGVYNRFINEEKDLLSMTGKKPILRDPIKSYAIGTRHVEKDQLAYLHKDEAVLNRHEAKDYREGRHNPSSTGTINLNINIEGKNVEKDIVDLVQRAVQQAISQLQPRNGIETSRSYIRVQN